MIDKTTTHYKLIIFAVIACCLVVVSIGFFANRQAQINRDADVRQAEIFRKTKVEQTEIEQSRKVEWTKERWGTLPWNRTKKTDANTAVNEGE